MAGRNSGAILKQMQALLGAGTFGGLSDGELLGRFLERRDEVAELAFAVLVERHGSMVLGVCRRIMGDPHDADDAFQATFLVLARRARSIRVEGSLGRWLFGVAMRVAMRARADSRRRRRRERPGLDRFDRAGSEPGSSAADRAELRAIVATEVAGLPARFRAPVLLCDLEGTSHEEAARRLGWPVGTVKSRLSRGRARLRDRLTRRGLTPADLAIVAAMARPPAALVSATTRAALALVASGRLTAAGIVPASVATLTQGVLRTMTLHKLAAVAAALMLVTIGSAALFGQAPPQPVPGPGKAAAATGLPGTGSADADRVDIEMLERAWADGINRRDASVISRILADDFEGIDPMGATFSKSHYLAMLNGGRLAQGVVLAEVKPRLFGDAGVVTTRLEPGPSHRSERATKLYIKRHGRWSCVSAHVDWLHGALAADDPEAKLSDAARQEWRNALKGWNAYRQFATSANQKECMVCHKTPVLEGQEYHWLKQPMNVDEERVLAPFDCRVEQTLVQPKQLVKPGDPLVVLYSKELIGAKMLYEAAARESKWAEDIVQQNKELYERTLISPAARDAAEQRREESRLRTKQALEPLLSYGLTQADIDRIGKADAAARGRLTIRARHGGNVVHLDAIPGRSYNRKDILIKIQGFWSHDASGSY